MPFDPEDPRQLQRLNNAMRDCYTELEQFRKRRTELIKDFVGTCYSDGGTEFDMPVNLMALTLDIYLMHLAGNRPQVLLTTANRDALPFIADFEAILNRELEEMAIDVTLRRWVMDAFFSVGILKTGLVDAGYIELIPGEPLPSQEYFAETVDLDDFVYDTRATHWERCTFLGDRYPVDYEAVMQAEDLNPRAKTNLLDAGGDEYGENDRAAEISRHERAETENIREFKRQIYFWDICLPEEGLIVTIPDKKDVNAAMKIVEWDGIRTSPYHILSFSEVPSNVMPLAPGALLKSLNRSINAVYRRLVDQARRQKDLSVFRHGNEDDARRVRDAHDGDMIPLEHPDTVVQISMGGASQQNLAFYTLARDVYSQLAGNLDALGGLGPQSETFRQDAMLTSTASKKAAKMTRAVVDATVGVIEDLAHRIYNDPGRTYEAIRPIPGTTIQVIAQMPPGERRFSLSDLAIKIEPFSMQYLSPTERASQLMQVITQLALPMAPLLAQQGIALKGAALFDYLAKYLSLPELQQIFQIGGIPTPGTAPSGEARQAAVTQRTYERVNRPGATRQGNTQTMLQALMGANPQQSQRAALTRPAGV